MFTTVLNELMEDEQKFIMVCQVHISQKFQLWNDNIMTFVTSHNQFTYRYSCHNKLSLVDEQTAHCHTCRGTLHI